MPKHWGVDPERMKLALAARGDARLAVDVGGNNKFRFPDSVTVGWEGDVKVDLNGALPFGDGEVDFLYCRHTLEDMADPARLLGEIRRVAKAGYLECPSPICELTRGVDAGGSHLGFGHHRWVCLGVGNLFQLCAKYPLAERLPLDDHWPTLQRGVRYWHTHCLFGVGPLEYAVLQHEQGIHLGLMDERDCHDQYLAVLRGMIDTYLQGEF